jgi:hypothetical protein
MLSYNRITVFKIQGLLCRNTSTTGKKSDGSVFRASTLAKMREKEELNSPFPTSLPLDDSGETFPYYFVADETFPLKIDLTIPYPRRMLTNKIRIFNYILSRARKVLNVHLAY